MAINPGRQTMIYTSAHRAEIMNSDADKAERLLGLLNVIDEIREMQRKFNDQPRYPDVDDGLPRGYCDRVTRYWDSLVAFYTEQRPGIMVDLDLSLWILTNNPWKKQQDTQC